MLSCHPNTMPQRADYMIEAWSCVVGPQGFEPWTDGLKVTSSRFILAILALPSTTSKNA